MATGTDAIILASLLDRLIALQFSPALAIAFPDIQFPASGQTKPSDYLAVTFLPNVTGDYDIADGSQQHRGILQVSVFYQSGTGLIKPLDIAGEIITHFAKGTTLFKDGLKIVIDRKPYSSPPIQDTDRMQIPVSISYHAFS